MNVLYRSRSTTFLLMIGRDVQEEQATQIYKK